MAALAATLACSARLRENVSTRQFMYARITCSAQLSVIETPLHAILRVHTACFIANSNTSYAFNSSWSLPRRHHQEGDGNNRYIKDGGWVPGGWYPV